LRRRETCDLHRRRLALFRKRGPMHYRKEIDGLRAIAVMAVILFHANFGPLANGLFGGGYVGVDIFFVISGYLISKIIFLEISSSSFSFLRFYERRARRILPLLLSIMLFCLPLAWLFLDGKRKIGSLDLR